MRLLLALIVLVVAVSAKAEKKHLKKGGKALAGPKIVVAASGVTLRQQLAMKHLELSNSFQTLAACSNEACREKAHNTIRRIRRAIRLLRRSRHHNRLQSLFRQAAACTNTHCSQTIRNQIMLAQRLMREHSNGVATSHEHMAIDHPLDTHHLESYDISHLLSHDNYVDHYHASIAKSRIAAMQSRKLARAARRAARRARRAARRAARKIARHRRRFFTAEEQARRHRRYIRLARHSARLALALRKSSGCVTKMCAHRMASRLRHLRRAARIAGLDKFHTESSHWAHADPVRYMRHSLARRARASRKLADLFAKASACMSEDCVERTQRKIRRVMKSIRRSHEAFEDTTFRKHADVMADDVDRAVRSERKMHDAYSSEDSNYYGRRYKRRSSRRSRRGGSKALKSQRASFSRRARLHRFLYRMYSRGKNCRTLKCFKSIRKSILRVIKKFRQARKERRSRRKERKSRN